MGSRQAVFYRKGSDGRIDGGLQLASEQAVSTTRFCHRTIHGAASASRSPQNIQYLSRWRSYWVPAAARSEKKEIFAIQFFLLIFMQPIAT